MTSSEATQRERIPTRIFASADQAATVVADEIQQLIEQRNAEGRPTVLGLATGSTPVRLYRELVRRHREQGLSFANVITFNLDEYYGLERDHPESYWRFMWDQLFSHVDIVESHVNLPSGTVERDEVFEYCHEYEKKIRESGGIDLQILGIGRTGHIGFNEPGSSRDSRTRLVSLDSLTRKDAARDFLGEENVPRHAITMGVGSILDARRIILMAWGAGKAEKIRDSVEGTPSEAISASLLQGHPSVEFFIDEPASTELTRSKTPWLVEPVDWNPPTTRRAITWLATRLKKPVLKLIDEEYAEHGMGDLLTQVGSAYDINIQVFNQTQHTITGWPGGKPNADDSQRPERAEPQPKRVLILAPEPGDDVCWMGGTIHRLIQHGHIVHIAYLTSGNLAVSDVDASQITDLSIELEATEHHTENDESSLASIARRQLEKKSAFDLDPPELRQIKGLIRRSQARSAARVLGLGVESLNFLTLPFYEKGRYRRFFTDDSDLKAVTDVIEEFQPNQIFACGGRADPSSLTGVCYRLIEEALRKITAEQWFSDCRVWLYRGGGDDCDWAVDEIDMAVPMSPRELERKLESIYRHQTQRSQSPLALSAGGEIWQHVAALNRHNAEVYDLIGMAEYEALEVFRRWYS